MATPMPLTVYGPVTPISPSVKVTGVVANAQVSIKANGTQIGQVVASGAGELFVPLTRKPSVGETITAIQEVGGVPSASSLTTISCVPPPNPLPIPVILSALNTCMVDILADGLVPGASVITSIGATAFGTARPAESPAWLGIDATQTIAPNGVISIVQKVGALSSPTATSSPIPLFTSPTDMLPAPVLGPLVQCDTSRQFLQVVPGAQTQMTNNGPGGSWDNVSGAFTGTDGPPLKAGVATAVQVMPRCHRTSQTAHLKVESARVPEPPVVSQDLCPLTLRLQVSNLAPGGTLHLVREVLVPNGPATTSVIGDVPISDGSQTIDLPPTFQATDPAGPVVVALTQSRCAGASSPAKLVRVAVPGAVVPPPAITAPAYACSRMISVTGASPGSNLQAFYPAGVAASDPVSVTQPDFLLRLWFPLELSRHTIEVHQTGCHAGNSTAVPILPVTKELLAPPRIGPVLPGDAQIQLSGLVPGARAQVWLNSVLLPGGFDVYTADATIPIFSGPLANGDQVAVTQSLCQFTSSAGVATATLGILHLAVTTMPSPLEQGREANVLVVATNAQNVAVNALPASIAASFDSSGNPVGPSTTSSTGTTFPYTPQPTDTNADVYVKGAPAYEDAELTGIPVVPPPLPPPSVNYDFSNNTLSGHWFPASQCSVKITSGAGTLPTGPFPGDIFTGITFSSPCSGNINESFNIRVESGTSSYNFKIPCGMGIVAGIPI